MRRSRRRCSRTSRNPSTSSQSTLLHFSTRFVSTVGSCHCCCRCGAVCLHQVPRLHLRPQAVGVGQARPLGVGAPPGVTERAVAHPGASPVRGVQEDGPDRLLPGHAGQPLPAPVQGQRGPVVQPDAAPLPAPSGGLRLRGRREQARAVGGPVGADAAARGVDAAALPSLLLLGVLPVCQPDVAEPAAVVQGAVHLLLPTPLRRGRRRCPCTWWPLACGRGCHCVCVWSGTCSRTHPPLLVGTACTSWQRRS